MFRMAKSAMQLCFAVTLLFAAGMWAAPEAKVGEAAPLFTAVDQVGNSHDLQSLSGKVVVLEWTNPECPFVVRHYREGTFKKLAGQYGSDGVVWLAVNSTHTNKAENSAAWSEKHGLSYPTLIDSDGSLGRLYGAKTTPHVYVIDSEGTLVYQGAVDDDAGGEKKPEERVRYLEIAIKSALEGQSPARGETRSYGCSVKYAE